MHFGERIWAATTYILNIISLSPVQHDPLQQIPLVVESQLSTEVAPQVIPSHGPFFEAPGDSQKEKFMCNYSTMIGWEECSTQFDRTCWLRRRTDGKQFDINTNYEKEMPIGITREYNVELENSWFAADGLNFTAAKLFKQTFPIRDDDNRYPGPWIQACWGDRLIVKVTNRLKHNGTSVHWHGIRQNQSMHMDGVNGITQCPITPTDYFVYNFTLTQYGSSWYHSHYSVQYADGAVGPLTIHGPSSAAEWQEAISPPLILTDWGHDTAFNSVTTKKLGNPSILLNGHGNVTSFSGIASKTHVRPPFHITVAETEPGQRWRKYLLRIINTSFESTFVFSIDHHMMQIVSADFVPIQPYYNTSVLVGIGQRYNVIVEANPLLYKNTKTLPTDGNYWIRTYLAECGGHVSPIPGYERTGILRYNAKSTAFPSNLSQPWSPVAKACADETYTSLHPILPWQVGNPSNGGDKDGEIFDLSTVDTKTYPLSLFDLAKESDNGNKPLRVDYSNITFLNLDNKGPWDPQWRIIPENYTSEDWVYLMIQGKIRDSTFGAHPIHLHGHDFALLEQAYHPYNGTLNLKFDNPPRRDVVLMPSSGYVVIAFKADNPGAWLLHCHIAFHISEGLGFQILERQESAAKIWPPTNHAILEAERVCNNWTVWQNDETNWANRPLPAGNCSEPGHPEYCFQDDSGV